MNTVNTMNTMDTQGAYNTIQKFTKTSSGRGFAISVNSLFMDRFNVNLRVLHLTPARYDVLVSDLSSKWGLPRKEFVGLYHKDIDFQDLKDDVDFVVATLSGVK